MANTILLLIFKDLSCEVAHIYFHSLLMACTLSDQNKTDLNKYLLLAESRRLVAKLAAVKTPLLGHSVKTNGPNP